MASISYRRGYGWSLPLLDRAARLSSGRGGGESGGIRVFSAKGLSAPGTLGTSPLPQIGTPIPGTNLVYVRPRLSQDELGGSGGSPFFAYRWPGTQGREVRVGSENASAVHYTNTEYAYYREKRRTPSIGMARAGQTGLTMAVPFESETPYFSVP